MNLSLLEVKDYEVLGIGAVRREELRGLHPVLLLHSALVPADQRPLYEAILAETLTWLEPQAVREEKLPQSTSDFLLQVMLEEMQKAFPQTLAALKGDKLTVLKDYLKEFPWQGPLVSAHFRYLPAFLKRRYQDARLYMIAQAEWLWSYLSFAEFGFPTPEKGRVIVNPSLQSLYSVSEISEVRLTQGLSVYYYDYSQNKIRDYKMDVWDAAIVDLLQEDRKFTLDQVLDQLSFMELESSLTREPWAKKLSYLINEGIILESGLGWIPGRK